MLNPYWAGAEVGGIYITVGLMVSVGLTVREGFIIREGKGEMLIVGISEGASVIPRVEEFPICGVLVSRVLGEEEVFF